MFFILSVEALESQYEYRIVITEAKGGGYKESSDNENQNIAG